MARAQGTDFFHAMRFHLVVNGNTTHPLTTDLSGAGQAAQAGFQACTTPSATVDVAPYREGHYVYTRKFPGIPTMEPLTLSRGVTFKDTQFWHWLQDVIEGNGEYREDVTIKHFHRKALPGVTQRGGGGQLPNTSAQALDLQNGPYRAYELFNAFPPAHKVAGDLDSTASEISIMTMGLEYESFEISDFGDVGPLVRQ